jgi:hypothetical protein
MRRKAPFLRTGIEGAGFWYTAFPSQDLGRAGPILKPAEMRRGKADR